MDKNITANIKQGISKYLKSRPSKKEQIFFIKRLSFLISSGLPMLDSLQMLSKQSRSLSHREIIGSIFEDVSSGKKLSKSFSNFPNMFDKLTVSIIRRGEESGTLPQSLDYLADELKKKQELKRKIIGSLVYPAIITIATIIITVFLVTYLFPKIMPVFLSLHMSLPLSTRIVIGLSLFMIKWGLLLLFAGLILVGVFIYYFKRNIKFQKNIHITLLHTPIISTVIRDYNVSNFTRTLGLLLKSQISLYQGLSTVAGTTTNLVFRDHFNKMQSVVDRGAQMSTYIKEHQYIFPEVVTQMVAVGERSGNLSDSLIYISEYYEQEIDEFTKNLSGLVEPIMMVFMGIIIGFIAISIITPIYSLTQGLHS
ncbi:MAG: type II secretion system F family protein [bacterium]